MQYFIMYWNFFNHVKINKNKQSKNHNKNNQTCFFCYENKHIRSPKQTRGNTSQCEIVTMK